MHICPLPWHTSLSTHLTHSKRQFSSKLSWHNPKAPKYKKTHPVIKSHISTLILLFDKIDRTSQDNLDKFNTILPAKGLIIFHKHKSPNIWRQHSNIWLLCYENLQFQSLKISWTVSSKLVKHVSPRLNRPKSTFNFSVRHELSFPLLCWVESLA